MVSSSRSNSSATTVSSSSAGWSPDEGSQALDVSFRSLSGVVKLEGKSMICSLGVIPKQLR